MTSRSKTVVQPKPDLASIAKKLNIDNWEKDQEALKSQVCGDPLEKAQIQALAKERQAVYESVGLAEDYSEVVIKDEKKSIQMLKDKLPNYRKQARFFSLEELKK